LIEAGDAARAQLAREVGILRQRLNAPAQVVQSLRRHPLVWLGGLAGTGLLGVLLLRRRRPAAPPVKSRGLRGLLLTAVIAAARPVVKTWLTGQLKQVLAAKFPSSFQPQTVISANSSFPTRL
jgi:hypothetical protein